MLLIAGLVGFGVLVFFLDDILDAFQQRYSIIAIVPDAPGVGPGTYVWVSGRRVGTVKEVSIRPSTADTLARVAVTLDLPRSVQSQVRRDSHVRLTSTSLVGEAVLDIIPGTAAAAVLQEGDTIRTRPGLSREELMARASAVRADMAALTAEARTLAPLVEARVAQTQVAFAGLDGAMAEVRRLQDDIAANPGLALLRDPAFRQSLESARGHAAALPGMMARLQAQAGAAGDVPVALGRLRARADTLALQLEAAAALLDAPAGTLGRFQNDAALVNAIEAARASLDSLVAEVTRNPLRFVF